MKQKVAILGSTGSIGLNAVDVIRRLKDKYDIVAISAYRNTALLEKQINEFNPKIICVGNETDARRLRKSYRKKIVFATDGLCEITRIPEIDTVLIAIVGSAALYPLVSAIKEKKRIALANKEALVVAGSLIIKLLKKYRATLIPVDSEHSAIFQCIKNENKNEISKLIITASGGPFLYRRKSFDNITVKEALKHPKWLMGKKITIDSATLVNKGLEVIEAHHLFGVPFNRIEVLIHPQSVVHSMVEFSDSTVIGLLSQPDMKLSIQYALTYPERYPTGVKRLKLEEICRLEFFRPDFGKFLCLKLVIEAGKIGHSMPAVMNAANEIAVESFLHKKIGFSTVPKIIEEIMNKHSIVKNPNLEEIISADKWARDRVTELVSSKYSH